MGVPIPKHKTHLPVVMLALMLVCFLGSGSALAIDPRFELDPKSLDVSVASPVARPQEAKPVPRQVKPEKVAGPHRPAKPRVIVPAQRFRVTGAMPSQADESLEGLHEVWPQLVPAGGGDKTPLSLAGHNYNVTLDRSRYPSFPAADGGKIIVDGAGTLPPLVRTLLQEQNPSLRIVSEDPANRRRFYGAMLDAARFHAVEEDFSVAFGSDPTLTVASDFMIEERADSLLNRNLVMLNVAEGHRPYPQVLTTFLGQEGFRVMETYPAPGRSAGLAKAVLYQVNAFEPTAITDTLLQALSLPASRDRTVELFGLKESGIKLEVRADRYFERQGERYVVSYFDGNAVNYTLTRLLETKGYKVIVLAAGDDFRTVAEKLFSRLNLAVPYAKQNLWTFPDTPYRVQLSGFMVRGPERHQVVFLTNRELDPVIRELVTINGYSVITN